MAKQPQNQDDQQELVFPYAGIELTHPSLMSRPDTTPVAENVRFFEPLTGRGRGGSRPGIDKFIPEQVSSNHEIQMIAAMVTVDGEMIDFSFDGPNQRFPGIYGGIGFIELDLALLGPFDFPTIPDDGDGGAVFVGGSGYPPFTKKNTPIKVVISADIASFPDGVPVGTVISVTGTLTDNDGNPLDPTVLDGKQAYMATDPPGEEGDGFNYGIGATIGNSVFVSAPKTVYYIVNVFSAIGNKVATSNRIHIRYVKHTVTVNWSNPGSITQGTALSATQLNATATSPGTGTVPGTFVYTPPSGTILLEGNGQTLSVDFTPDDTVLFIKPPTKTVAIDVTASHPDVPSIAVQLAGFGNVGPGPVAVNTIPGPPINTAPNLALAASLVGLPTVVYLASVFFNDGSFVGASWNWTTMQWEA